MLPPGACSLYQLQFGGQLLGCTAWSLSGSRWLPTGCCHEGHSGRVQCCATELDLRPSGVFISVGHLKLSGSSLRLLLCCGYAKPGQQRSFHNAVKDIRTGMLLISRDVQAVYILFGGRVREWARNFVCCLTHPALDAGCLQGNGGSLGSDYLQGLSALCSWPLGLARGGSLAAHGQAREEKVENLVF